MNPDERSRLLLVLPAVWKREPRPGVYRLQTGARVRVKGYPGSAEGLRDLFQAVGLASRLDVQSEGQPILTLDRPGECAADRAQRALQELLAGISDPLIKAQAYALEISESGAAAAAGGAPGLF
jgi:hypothetical protein